MSIIHKQNPKTLIGGIMRLFKRVDPYELHKLGSCGKRDDAKRYLQQLKKTNPGKLSLLFKTPRKPEGLYPLNFAIGNVTEEDYSVAALFLEYEADPYARLPGPYNKGSTLLHEAIQKRNLGELRLFVFCNAEYREVLDQEGKTTAYEVLQQWASSKDAIVIFYKGSYLTVVDLVEQTAQASREIKRLIAEANAALVCRKYSEAIYCCQKIQAIYGDQTELERAIPYPSALVAQDPWIEKKQPYMISYYKDKMELYIHYEMSIRRWAKENASRSLAKDAQEVWTNPLLELELPAPCFSAGGELRLIFNH